MNKNMFRIIFNKQRSQFMVVAETASSQGKGSRGEAVTSGHPAIAGYVTLVISTLSFAVMCALGVVLWALPVPNVHAQVVAYRNAPGNQQPTVLQTANGVPQVNIQTPSAAGVSRNIYSQFDVQSNGVILNNSRTNVQTQQGGWVQGNPWLATGSARVILNEINSVNPSDLNGYVEVAGQRAEVVIANPSGISVNGGGFINTSKATLTTGTPTVNGGSLDGYRVQGGSIIVNGNGLDLSTTDYAAILARAVQVNSGIWANDLKVVTGVNQIDASNLAANTTLAATNIEGTGVVPSFALDVAQIGGMYAGKIHLVGMEEGLGVRSAGSIGSTGGDLVLQNNGWLTTTGSLQASANLHITAQGNITNGGTLYASNDHSLNATGSITNSGVIAAQANTTIAANSFSSNAKGVVGAGIKADGTSVIGGNLNIATTQGLTANGQNLAAGNIALTGVGVDLSGSQTSAANIAITATSGDVNMSNATVTTVGTLGIASKVNNSQTLNNTQGVLSAAQLNVDVANFNNTHGQVIQTGTGDTSITLTSPTGTLNNTNGIIATNSVNLNLNADTLTNTDGKTQHAGTGTLHVTANTLNNQRGKIFSNNALVIDSGALSNLQGLVAANGIIAITAASVDNTLGTLASVDKTLSVTTTGATTNDSGKIQAALDVTLNNAGLSNTRTTNALATSSTPYGSIIGRNVDINTNTQKLINAGGTIAASQDANFQTGVLNNDSGYIGSKCALTATSANISNQNGQIHGLDNLFLTAGNGSSTGAINNKDGTLVADRTLTVTASSLSGDGRVLSKNDLIITLNSDFSNSGQVIANHDATLTTSGNVSNSSKLQAGNTLNLTANTIDNTATGEISAINTQVNASSALANRGLIDGVDTQINANTVNNIGTGRIYGDHLSIAAVNLTNDTETIGGVTKAGTIAARDRLDLGIRGTLTNREHALIYSVGDIAIGGAFDANRRATGSATALNNNSATIEAGRNLSLSSATVNNTNEHFAYEVRVATTELDVREDINSGLYRVFTRITYQPYQTASDPAQILAGGDINLSSTNATNFASHIAAAGTLTIASSTLANTDVMATKSIHDTGTTYTLVHVPASGYCGKISYNCVHAHDEWQTGPYDSKANSTVVVAQVTASSNSGAQVSSLDSGTVDQTLATVGSADARSGNITLANVAIPEVGAVTGRPVDGANRGTHLNTTLPTSSLYKNNPSSNSAYLIETDTRFIDRKLWLGSDYMTQSLSLDPTVTQKRLGDGFYEQKLIREQVAELTGRRFLADYTSDEQEYKALMTSAITFGQKHNLRPGIALTAQQVAQLTSDIVWLVEQTITLPDGSSQKVLVPQVYVIVQPGDLDGSGALLAGKDVTINLSGDLTNSGTIAGRNIVSLTTENVNNLGGRIDGTDVSVAARQDLINMGGNISAVNNLSAIAGRDLSIQTTIQSTNTQVGSASFSRTGVDRIAGLYISGANGTLVASAGRDLNIVAGVVSNVGIGTTSLDAGNNLALAAVKTGEQNSITWNADNHLNYGDTQEVGSTINGGGNVSLKAGNYLTATAANVQTSKALGVQVGGNVNILAGENTTNLDEAHKTSSGGDFMGESTLMTRHISNTSSAVGSNFAGSTVEITADTKDIKFKGSNVVSDIGTKLTAAGNVTIEAAQNTSQQSSYSKQTDTGFLSGGGLSVSYGTRTQSNDGKDTTTTATASTVGSVGGGVTISAGNQYKQVGSDVITPAGDIAITAKTVDIVEARETNKQSSEQKFEQSGLTLAVNSTVLSTLENAQNQIKATIQTSDGRMKALGAATGAANVKMAEDALKAGQGDENGMVKTGAKNNDGSLKTNADGTPETAQANAADKAGGIQVSLNYGQSSNQNNSTATSYTARSSTVKAGTTTTIKATGAGADSNLTVQDSDVSGKTVNLNADNKVNFLAAQNTTIQISINSNSSASAGAAAQLGNGGGGTGFTGSLSAGKGSGNGSETNYINTHVTGVDSVTIKSGADIHVQGATVEGKQVTAMVGGNLNIESLQDTASDAEKYLRLGASGIVGAGMSGSVNYAKSIINSTYASVTEQSGFKAGEGGFQVDVKGNTDLKGGAITSTQSAIDNNKNTFNTGGTLTTSDIENKASYEAKSVSVSLAAGGTPLPNQGLAAALSGAGMGKDSGSSSSTTTAGISGLAGDSSKRTGDNAQGIGKIFDAEKVRQEIQAQTKITQEFAKQASTAVQSYSDQQKQTLQDQLKKANEADKPALKQQLDQVILEEKVLNILVGAVTGFGQTMVTKESLRVAAEQMRQAVAEDSAKFKGVVDSKGNPLFSNESGDSVGVDGDGKKYAGTRADLDRLCGVDNSRCAKNSAGGLTLTNKGQVEFIGAKKTDGTRQTYVEFLQTEDGKKMLDAPFGGQQGSERTWLFGEYPKGGIVDKLLEAFAGPHDTIGGKWSGLYDDLGNTTRGRSDITKATHEVWSGVALIPAVPFAATTELPPEVWKAIEILLKGGK